MNRLGDLATPAEEWAAGSVEFTDWHRLPWTDAQAKGVYGEVRVVESDKVVGFAIRGGAHANWIAVVRGPSGVVFVVPGCQVATITYGSNVVCRDFWAVP